MVSNHFTELVICLSMRCLITAPWLAKEAVELVITPQRGSANDVRSSSFSNSQAATATSGLCQAPATLRRTECPPAALSLAESCSRPASSPETTICDGAFRLAMQTVPSCTSSTNSSSRARLQSRIAIIPPEAPSDISRPRSLASRKVCSRSSTLAAYSAENSPRL